MAKAIEKRMNGRSSRVREIGLFASCAATAALFVTYCSGNRNLGFGRSISGAEQKLLLIVAGLLMLGFGAASVVSRYRANRSNLSVTGSEGKRNDEV